MFKAIEIPPGNYEIGNESIPNAAPRHMRRLEEPVWVDAHPVSWAHFEVFVAAGGYADQERWPAGLVPIESFDGALDRRCAFLFQQGEAFRRQLKNWPGDQRTHPVTGLTWLEAAAIARFYGARLPFEVEWEAAMALPLETAKYSPGQKRTSRLGCPLLLGMMQEWTADVFASVYYRADFANRGIAWSPESGGNLVSVRGSSPSDLYQHVATRVGRNPREGHSHCGFRRAWDHCPGEAELLPAWR